MVGLGSLFVLWIIVCCMHAVLYHCNNWLYVIVPLLSIYNHNCLQVLCFLHLEIASVLDAISVKEITRKEVIGSVGHRIMKSWGYGGVMGSWGHEVTWSIVVSHEVKGWHEGSS